MSSEPAELHALVSTVNRSIFAFVDDTLAGLTEIGLQERALVRRAEALVDLAKELVRRGH